MGHQVLGDKLEGFAGPLAGMHAALHSPIARSAR
jgi:molybdopterin-guanine dinucleotide biosynthesis protein A